MVNNTNVCAKRITEYLKNNVTKSVPYKALYAKSRGKKITLADFNAALKQLEDNGIIFKTTVGYKLTEENGLFRATVSRLSKTFGFIKKDDETELFVPGKLLMGAMPGDVVLAKTIPPRKDRSADALPDAEVVKIIEENFNEFTGVLEKDGGTFAIRPDTISKDLLIVTDMAVKAEVGDKVLAEIWRRGERHSDHRVRIKAVFGSSEDAVSSAEAVLYMNNVETEFPAAVIDEAKKALNEGIPDGEINHRLDLRDEIIFTIDGADTKDIDDAVSVEKLNDGWKLGVHIADVSFYVKANSELDRDAFSRGTSIYYANKVVPMLPKELSNGICSLNPNEDRLAFSCVMKLSEDGKLEKFKFSKSVIRSRVKGVYSEINSILDCIENKSEIPAELAVKYNGLEDSLVKMKELAAILTANKIKRGAPQLETPEPKLVLDENNVCIDVLPKERGKSELFIEEFMLMANTAAAKLARENEIPFVYRVHEDPSAEKISELVEFANGMNIPVPHFTDVKPKHLAQILESTKDTPLARVINNMVLRSMAKAKYSPEPLGHFGLVLDDYSHFTSPIRRYPDLAIHRILTDLCYNKKDHDFMVKRYAGFATQASEQSSKCELTAMKVERDCDDCFMAEYMRAHMGEVFDGLIVSVQDFGFFVELASTVEGLVKTDTLDGLYSFDGKISLVCGGRTTYSVGQAVKVVCAGVNVASGQIDFTIVKN